jgi:hypothetical protein
MASTGSHLRIRSYGENVLGVILEGDSRKPEPIHFRVYFPGGDVDVVRCDNGENWIHIRVNRKGDGHDPDRVFGRLVDARMDCLEKPHHGDVGALAREDLWHLAVRIQHVKE